MGGSFSRRVVGEPIELGSINGGEPVLAVLSRVDVYRPEGNRVVVHFLLDVDYDTYVHMDENGAFGMGLFSVDPSAGTAQFTGDLDLELTLRAADELIPEGASDMTDAQVIDAFLRGLSEEPDRYLDATMWQWISVMQRLEGTTGAMQGIRSKFPAT